MAGIELGTAIWIILGIIGMLLVILLVYANRYKRVPPDAAMVVFGRKHIREIDGKKEDVGFSIVKGGGKFIMPIVESVEFLPLDVRTLDISVPTVVTSEGVMLDVEAVAQTKIASDMDSLYTAAEQLLRKTHEEIDDVAKKSLEGHVRGVCANLTVEQINSDRDRVAQDIQTVAIPDLKNMGLEIRSFTIRDLKDKVGYLEALGKKRTAEVKRTAIIGEAEANRDSKIKSAEADREGETARALADTEIAKAHRDKSIKMAEYEAEVKSKEADRDVAYEMQKTLREQELIKARMEVQIREKEKQIELQEKEIERKEKELEATVRKPAIAEADKEAYIAEGRAKALRLEGEGKAEAEKAIKIANAEADKIRGIAEAEVAKAKALAEAEGLRAKKLAEADGIRAEKLAIAEGQEKMAEALAKLTEAGKTLETIKIMPKMIEAITPAFEKMGNITVIQSGGDSRGGVTRTVTDSIKDILATAPAILKTYGID
ncbi:MAG: flotillin family protein, partial [Methanosarcinales archaeon]